MRRCIPQLYRGVCTDQCVRVNMNTFIEKAAVLTEALPFIQQFRGETVVVKFGGSIMENEAGVRNISGYCLYGMRWNASGGRAWG